MRVTLDVEFTVIDTLRYISEVKGLDPVSVVVCYLVFLHGGTILELTISQL